MILDDIEAVQGETLIQAMKVIGSTPEGEILERALILIAVNAKQDETISVAKLLARYLSPIAQTESVKVSTDNGDEIIHH